MSRETGTAEGARTDDRPPLAPLFAVGAEVRVGYLGLLATDEPGGRVCRVQSIRLLARVEDDYAEEIGEAKTVTTYPRGWEYLLVGAADGKLWGWETEADLLAAGYRPAADAEPDVIPFDRPALVCVVGVDGVEHRVSAADTPGF